MLLSWRQTLARTSVALTAATTLFLAGCDGLGASPDAPVTVVEAYLVAGEPLSSVRLTRTVAVDDAFDIGQATIRDASLRIEQLAADGTVAEQFPYTFSSGSLLYTPSATVPDVEPGTSYRLVADLADGSVVSSTTTVPGGFRIESLSATSVVYQGPEQIEVEVSRSVVDGRQTYFVFSVASLDVRQENLTPLYEEFLGDDGDLDDVRVTESPPFNEQNYEVSESGTLTIKLPWLAVAFYGPNRIVANSIDDNLYDFLRSQQVQQGGSTFAPGEIPNVISRVDGGTGVFASLARVSAEVEILR